MEYTTKQLVELLNIRQQNIDKALKETPYTLKEVGGSSKKVKHYKYDDLPQRYKDKIEPPKDESKDTDILKAKTEIFTQKYLTAKPEKREVAVLKVKLIEFYLMKDASKNTQKWLDDIFKSSIEFDKLGNVKEHNLYKWLKKYNNAKAKGLPIVDEFIDVRGNKKGNSALSEEQQKIAVSYFMKSNDPVISEIYRNMCHYFGDTMPSEDALRNYYKTWRIDNPVLYEFNKSPDSAKNKFQAAFGDISAKAKYRNHFVELDSTPADVICEDGKRYAVLAAIDIYTRRVVFHVSETSSAFSISQLLRKYILKFGIPDNVVIDNGKDYVSNHFESICLNLGINREIVPPYSGEMKPHVERVFGTLSRELFEQIPGYIGHSVADRAALQARMSFSDKIEAQRKWRDEQKLKSDVERKAWSDAWKLKKENRGLDLNILLSADELQSWCDRWVDKIYNQRIHSKLKTTPLKKWNSSTNPVQSIPDERMLDLLLGESKARKVGKKGISFDGCHYAHIDLIEYIGHYVYVMAPQDLGYVLVYTESMKFICIAEDTEFIGQDRYKARSASKKSRALMRQMEKIAKEYRDLQTPTILDRIEAAPTTNSDTQTAAVTKHTEAVTALLNSSKEIVAKDQELLETSNRYDFKNKDEDGKPQKVLPSGRPAFDSFFDRFVWCLENNEWNEKDEKLKTKNPDIYQMAYKDVESRKVG